MLYLGARLRTPSSFSRRAKSAASLDREYELALSGPLEDRGHALAATDAHYFKAVADLLASHLMHQGGHDANAGGADRMTERDARPVDVENCAIIPSQTFEDRQNLHGKGHGQNRTFAGR